MIWLERLNRYLLWLAIIVLPWQLRHTFFFAYHNGEFFEYASLSFYLSDVVILCLLVVWLVEIFFKRTSFVWGPKSITYAMILWLVWMWVSVIITSCSTGNGAVAALAVGHFTLFFSFYLYLLNHVKDIRNLLWPLAMGVVLQNVLATGQYWVNRSLGWKWLGESVLNPNELGIPVVLVAGERQLRAHGTLPHANILGGILAYATTVLIAGYSGVKIYWQQLIIWAIITLSFVAIILSFSRSAWLAMGLAGLFLLVTASILGHYLVKVNWWLLIITLGIVLGLIVYQWPAITSRFDLNQNNIERESIVSRVGQWEQFQDVFAVSSWFGLGVGQYSLKLEQDDIKSFGWHYDTNKSGWEYSIGHQVWDYQPIHNIYLLALAETGVVGGLLLIWLLLSVLVVGWWSTWRTRNLLGWGVWLGYVGILTIGLFDHYLWTLQQGRLILFLSIGLISIYSINQQLYDGRAPIKSDI
ncbi:MAG: O-antigen ligase family protein [Patescibacteria group bacterium]